MDNSYFYAFFIMVILLFLYLILHDKIYLYPFLLTSNIESVDISNEKDSAIISNIDL